MPQRSNLPAQTFTTGAIQAWRPRSVLLADIGGGIWGGEELSRDNIALGDVVVAEHLHYYELVKVTGAGRPPRYVNWLQPSSRLSDTARHLDDVDPSWRNGLTVDRPDSSQPRMAFGEICCGDKLLADEHAEEAQRLVGTYDKALAVDMETVGVAHALNEAVDGGFAVNFAALRGISDFMDREGNQGARDRWKLAASDAAVTAAIAVISSTPALDTAIPPDERALTEATAAQLQGDYRLDGQPYRSTLQAGTESFSSNDAPAVATSVRRAVIVGQAGSGKTSILVRATAAHQNPLEPFGVLVDLKRWQPDWSTYLSDRPVGEEMRSALDGLLRASIVSVGVDVLERIIERRGALLCVDGLNEVPFAQVGRPILTLLDEVVRAYPRLNVLVTDRTGSAYDEMGWRALRVLPLDDREVDHVVTQTFGHEAVGAADTYPLLRIPFFLDRAVKANDLEHASRADALRAFLAGPVGLNDDELDKLAKLAFDAYASDHRRTLAPQIVGETLGEQRLATLLEAGVLLGDEDAVRFDHQLEHDYLAARHLADDAGLWTPSVFDALTFRAASFDAISMALEMQSQLGDRDALLRKVYDWNWRATVAAMAAVERDGAPCAATELRFALLAVIAEKRFDEVQGTAGRASEHLSRFPGAEPAAFAAAGSLERIIEIVAAFQPGSEWFERWRAMFCRMPVTDLTEDELEPIAGIDPVEGWTMANTARRFSEAGDRSLQVRGIYTSRPAQTAQDRTVRWRAVHVLGAWPSIENLQLLVRALADDDEWVVYGAVRSIVEISIIGSDQALQDACIQALQGVLADLADEPLSQIAWAAMHRKAGEEHAERIRPLLAQILEMQVTAAGRERWTSRIERFEEYWAVQQ